MQVAWAREQQGHPLFPSLPPFSLARTHFHLGEQSAGMVLTATLLSSTVIYFQGLDVAGASAGQFGVAWKRSEPD